MTNDQIHRAIVKILGWTEGIGDGQEFCSGWKVHGWWTPEPNKCFVEKLPLYTHSLNLCQGFEATIKDELTSKLYSGYLVSIVKGNLGAAYEPTREDWARSQRANASQRCEAFLRTHGEWKGQNG